MLQVLIKEKIIQQTKKTKKIKKVHLSENMEEKIIVLTKEKLKQQHIKKIHQ